MDDKNDDVRDVLGGEKKTVLFLDTEMSCERKTLGFPKSDGPGWCCTALARLGLTKCDLYSHSLLSFRGACKGVKRSELPIIASLELYPGFDY